MGWVESPFSQQQQNSVYELDKDKVASYSISFQGWRNESKKYTRQHFVFDRVGIDQIIMYLKLNYNPNNNPSPKKK